MSEHLLFFFLAPEAYTGLPVSTHDSSFPRWKICPHQKLKKPGSLEFPASHKYRISLRLLEFPLGIITSNTLYLFSFTFSHRLLLYTCVIVIGWNKCKYLYIIFCITLKYKSHFENKTSLSFLFY